MSIFDRFRRGRRVSAAPKAPRESSARPPRSRSPFVRKWDAAESGRLFAGWTVTPTSADVELRQFTRALRARGREIAQNDPYGRRFLRLLEQNVIGRTGIELVPTPIGRDGMLDVPDAQAVADAWRDWGRRGSCTVCGRFSWREVQKIVLTSTARDGEILVRPVVGSRARNPYGFALELLEADLLDDTFDDVRPDGTVVRMGVEREPGGRPVAYHVLNAHPGELGRSAVAMYRNRVPASEVIHAALFDRPSQSRGVTWFAASAVSLRHLWGYREAELVAARVAAAKMGFYRTISGEEYDGETVDRDQVVHDAEAGSFEEIPEGWDVVPWDPQHPTTAFGDFNKAILRGVAAGLGLSYNALAADLEGVNFSSLRAGALDERDHYAELQGWLIESVLDPVFDGWLREALLSPALPLPATRREKFAAHRWQTRGWRWVDPDKESNAANRDLRAGLATVTDVLADRGRTLEETVDRIAEERELFASKGLVHPIDQAADTGAGEGGSREADSQDD